MCETLRRAAKAPSFTEALARANMDPLYMVHDEINALTRKEINM